MIRGDFKTQLVVDWQSGRLPLFRTIETNRAELTGNWRLGFEAVPYETIAAENKQGV